MTTVAVAVSGGIDSLMAAFFLKEKGYRVFGVHFLTGDESAAGKQTFCIPKPDGNAVSVTLPAVERIGQQLGIRIDVVDLSKPFGELVKRYFALTYQSGKTPNPCLICNPKIKFGHLLAYARRSGASMLATGHYARIRKDSTGAYRLLRGIDPKKDQSYFLAFMDQRQLSCAQFPLGEMTKEKVIAIALENGLEPISDKESQDVCFIRGRKYAEFLGLTPAPGPIEDLSGRTIGEHQGLHLFTVGQRKGINCPASEPYYVIRLELPTNRLIVGQKKDLYQQSCHVQQINWIFRQPAGPLRVLVRVRYRHAPVPAVVTPDADRCATVCFDVPQPAITPGQGAVFYDGEEVLGGGWIT
jgi:tRNA-specific 2-thiouridylase